MPSTESISETKWGGLWKQCTFKTNIVTWSCLQPSVVWCRNVSSDKPSFFCFIKSVKNRNLPFELLFSSKFLWNISVGCTQAANAASAEPNCWNTRRAVWRLPVPQQMYTGDIFCRCLLYRAHCLAGVAAVPLVLTNEGSFNKLV